MPNRLAGEASPYLLQHADNPVDWYAWGPEAFERARLEDRPIFLSIGYSTCHWCHVMAHESFEDPAVADALNREFVSIKVDREERPDVDRVYMSFVQATTGAGGWPMSVWLTPDLKPFYGGTYFPPTSRWGRPGFIDILQEVSRVWRAERARVVESAEDAIERLRAFGGAAARGPVADASALREGVAQFAATFDRARGGFGSAPKFPRPTELLFLLRDYARTGDQAAREMVLLTLKAMAVGGMRDHLGGGFHRYSVDGEWRVPHFEKMLYDQAQLVLAYVEASLASGDALYAEVAEDTLSYVRRDMTSAEGAFYSAEDADSLPPESVDQPGAHKSEGAFYIWSESDIDALLGADAEVFKLRYGIRPGGNAPSDPQGEFAGRNLLYVALPLAEVARRSATTEADVTERIARARPLLFETRSKRPRPHLDDKVLTAWNGLMIAAFARAARTSRDRGAGHLAAAQTAAGFIRDNMWNESTGELLRRYRDGQAAIPGYAEDYACLIFGLVELFQADGDVRWLDWALRLQDEQNRRFWDEAGGGWFSTTGEDPSVLLRVREDYDGAEPSASSVSVSNLLVLAHLVPSVDEAGRIERTLGLHGPKLGQYARMLPMMMCGLEAYHAGIAQLVILGPRDRADTQALVDVVAGGYLPFVIALSIQPGEHQASVARTLPFVGELKMLQGKATAYWCHNFVCDTPIVDPVALRERMASSAPSGTGKS